jgi:putative ABC transport system permease protein
MKIPLNYSYRNLWTRRLTTILTTTGVALVVFVFAAVLMLESGLKKTLVKNGSPENFTIVRRSATSDLLSTVSRDAARLLETFPEVASGPDGKPLISREVALIVNLKKHVTNDLGNVIVRGVSPEALVLREQVKLIQGRSWEPGKSEIIVGKSISDRFQGCKIGNRLKFGTRTWNIVGVFEAERSGFESEIWGDVEQMMEAFKRPAYSTVTLRLKNRSDVNSFQTRMKAEPRLQYLVAKSEPEWYSEQSKALASFIKVLGLVVTGIFSFGAMIGAMITMYAAVSNRTAEIGTLRALGFLRRNILISFLIEALFLSLLGGGLGIVFASFLQTLSISMLNFATFSELAFRFDLTAGTIIASMIFALIMGLLGGFLPAVRAARLEIVNSLRA